MMSSEQRGETDSRDAPTADPPRVIPPRSRDASYRVVARDLLVFSIVHRGVSRGYGDAARFRSPASPKEPRSRERTPATQRPRKRLVSPISLSPPTRDRFPIRRGFRRSVRAVVLRAAGRPEPALAFRVRSEARRAASRVASNATRHERDEVPHGGVDPELQVSTEHRAIERTLERACGVPATAHAAHALVAEVVPARERHRRRALALAAKIPKAHHAPKVIRQPRANVCRAGRRWRATFGGGAFRRRPRHAHGGHVRIRRGRAQTLEESNRRRRRRRRRVVGAASRARRRVVPRPAASGPRRVRVSSAGVADDAGVSSRASLRVFTSTDLGGDERADGWVSRDGYGGLALVVPRRDVSAAGEECLHAPRVPALGGDVERGVARAVRFGDVHGAGEEDGAQDLGVAALRGAEESHPEEGGPDGGGDVLRSVRVEKFAQAVVVARRGGGDERGAVRAAVQASSARHGDARKTAERAQVSDAPTTRFVPVRRDARPRGRPTRRNRTRGHGPTARNVVRAPSRDAPAPRRAREE